MTVNKRKKNTRQRGSKTHGWGAKKKHRGKGHQGGAGMAGSGKRADTKKPSIWKDTHYFGKYGFVSKTPKVKIYPVNIAFIEENLENLLSKDLVKKDGAFYAVELDKLGYNKLLGDGRVSNKFKIKAKYASKSAMEKIKEAGGEVTGLIKLSNKEKQ